jgi:UDP-N-acetylglucosamine 2-epimerase (non-hydrolysing)
MKLCFVLGTRPEIIKLSPVIRECTKRKIPFFIMHTNQHFSKNMDSIFFSELELDPPKYNLGISNESLHGKMTGLMLEQIEEILLNEKPNIVLVQGDTNSALAGALAAAKLQMPVAHVEAGLRSYDHSMPEETNRVIADHVSTYLFAPTKTQKMILIGEGIDKTKIFVTGNTIVDAINENLIIAKKKVIKTILEDYILLTMHRPSNVDNKKILQVQIDNLTKLSREFRLPIIFPIHPRTKKQL